MIKSFWVKREGNKKTIEGQVCYIGALCLSLYSAEFCGWVGIMTLLVPDPYFPCLTGMGLLVMQIWQDDSLFLISDHHF